MKNSGNGSKQWLLWINTILTAGAAFIGGRLWDKIDRLNDAEIKSQIELKALADKQTQISREHHAIFQRLDKIEKLKQ